MKTFPPGDRVTKAQVGCLAQVADLAAQVRASKHVVLELSTVYSPSESPQNMAVQSGLPRPQPKASISLYKNAHYE